MDCTICGEPDDCKQDHIEHLIDRWHNGEGEGRELHEFLGMTWEQYIRWLGNK